VGRPLSRVPRVSYLVKWLERGLRLGLDEALAPHAISTPEYTALSVLRERDGLSSAQLARRVFVTAQAMNQIVIRLEKKGLIQRHEATQGRTMGATLTAKGAALLVRCDEATLSVEERVLACLSRAEVVALCRALSTCVAALGNRRWSKDERQALPARARGGKANGSRADLHRD
jgi:DNA-binding MarR family transcriptional regulator